MTLTNEFLEWLKTEFPEGTRIAATPIHNDENKKYKLLSIVGFVCEFVTSLSGVGVQIMEDSPDHYVRRVWLDRYSIEKL